MITKDIDVNGEKFRVMLTEQVINHVNNLKSLYDAAYEDCLLYTSPSPRDQA